MYITILTLFPDMFRGPFDMSIINRAIQKGVVSIKYVNIRDFATDKHKSVDDHPYGGGAGMILRVDVVSKAIDHAKTLHPNTNTKTILMDPQGKQFSQRYVKQMATVDHLILLCGHYEGVDERIRTLVDDEFSIGDYVLTCGELPAMVIVDTVVRLLPGVLKKEGVTTNESFEDNLLEYPQYTKPDIFNGLAVPDILRSGNHSKILEWQKKEAIKRTSTKRPDLT
ncbi:MAG: tRNA (guanosine(37)-N1)-methyltransferase TrmD [Candidatus Gottesmanbacteria bacterium]